MRQGVGATSARIVATAAALAAVAAITTTVVAVLGVLDVQQRNPYRPPQTLE
ncbi:hypothetical protein [Rhodococcus sp. Q]|uniref:hypothetical protein n=1 Tax=Rhodococcus sp. Q TaxID=2502252 RepID=UPI00148582A0|nr:hypothetical protein [Rhodococcus sp. Q]